MEMDATSFDVNLRRLRKTSIPTIIVEGKDDFLLLHWLLRDSNADSSNVIVAGDRAMLLKLFTEVTKNKQKYPNVKLFMADKDMFVFTGVPENYSEVQFSEGYSIENDLFFDSEIHIDRSIRYPDYSHHKKQIIDNLSKWFAFEVEDFIRQNEIKETRFKECNLLNENIFSINDLNFTDKFLKSRNFIQPSIEIYNDIHDNYQLKLRGHTLFQALNILSSKLKPKDVITYRKIERGIKVEYKSKNPPIHDAVLLNFCYAYSIGIENSLICRRIAIIKTALEL